MQFCISRNRKRPDSCIRFPFLQETADTGLWCPDTLLECFGTIPFAASCVFLIGYVPTESMEPTLERGSYIIGRRIYSNLETGDIILFRHNGKLLVKRVAAGGGDTAEKNGISMTVPEARCYVLGDNADSSYDSRYWLNPFVDGADVAVKLIS